MKYGRYQVVSEIGRGSMGVVYQAHDPQIDRLVALKVLREDRVSSTDYVRRFLKEATAVGRLSHRGIVTVYDVGEDHGTVYIAMELLEGVPLNELLKQRRFTLEEIVEIGIAVADALHYAHQKGIVHRDIKPANIICSENRDIKVTDFGIAHIEDPDGQQMTQAGEILGTPVYMSPEQVLGQPVDGRSDIYSLGVILYELTTGQRPFAGANLGALFKAITSDSVTPPISLNPSVPAWISAVIMKAINRDPTERYASGEQLAGELRAGQRQSSAPRQSRPQRKKLPLVLVACLLLLGSLVGTSHYLGLLDRPVANLWSILTTIKLPWLETETTEPPVPGEVDTVKADDEGRSSEIRTQKSAAEEPTEEPAERETTQPVVSQPASEQRPMRPPSPPGQPVDTAEERPVSPALPKATQIPDPADDLSIFSNTAFDEPPAIKPVPDPEVRKQPATPSAPSDTKVKEVRPVDPSATEQEEIFVAPVSETPADKASQSPEPTDTMMAFVPEPAPSITVTTLLKLTSRPPGARIYIDGEYAGETPGELTVSADKHEVELQLTGHGDWKAQLDLSKGGEMPLSIRLLPQ
jgi:serine/threonine-protein kinase